MSGTVHTGLGPHNMTVQSWSCVQLRQSYSRACLQMALLCFEKESSLHYLCLP